MIWIVFSVIIVVTSALVYALASDWTGKLWVTYGSALITFVVLSLWNPIFRRGRK